MQTNHYLNALKVSLLTNKGSKTNCFVFSVNDIDKYSSRCDFKVKISISSFIFSISVKYLKGEALNTTINVA